MKPFVWRPGAPLTPIPGRAPKRGRKPRKVAPALVVPPPETLTAADAGSLTFGPRLTLDVVMESVRQINAMQDRWNEAVFFGVWPVRSAAPAEDEFEALNAEIARRGPTFEVDRTGRCMVCGEFRCAWWAAFCAWRDGQGPRPNWRDGSIDTTCSEVGAQALLEGGGA